jgi:hypothetical protein
MSKMNVVVLDSVSSGIKKIKLPRRQKKQVVKSVKRLAGIFDDVMRRHGYGKDGKSLRG